MPTKYITIIILKNIGENDKTLAILYISNSFTTIFNLRIYLTQLIQIVQTNTFYVLRKS